MSTTSGAWSSVNRSASSTFGGAPTHSRSAWASTAIATASAERDVIVDDEHPLRHVCLRGRVGPGAPPCITPADSRRSCAQIYARHATEVRRSLYRP